MKQLLLAIVFAIASNGAVAEWTQVGGGSDNIHIQRNNTEAAAPAVPPPPPSSSDYILYVDFSSIRASGNTVKMWDLKDYESSQERIGIKYLSTKSHIEYDCVEKQVRTLFYSWFSKGMAKGEEVYSERNLGKWNKLVPGSIAMPLRDLACSKRNAHPITR